MRRIRLVDAFGNNPRCLEVQAHSRKVSCFGGNVHLLRFCEQQYMIVPGVAAVSVGRVRLLIAAAASPSGFFTLRPGVAVMACPSVKLDL